MKRFFSILLIASLAIAAMVLVSCTEEPPVEPGHTHNYTSKVVAATCLTGGYTEHTCDCGYIMRDTFTNPSNTSHDFQKSGTLVEPTCTEDGYELFVCSVCGEEDIRDPKPSRHTWSTLTGDDGWVEIQAPSCMDMGIERRECIYCDVFEERQTASDHPWGEPEVTPADCENAEILKYTCSVEGCGATKEELGRSALGHMYGEWYVEKDSTCEELGVMRRDCIRCDGKVNDCEIEDCDHSTCGTVICDIENCDHSTCGTDICDHYETKDIPRHHYTIEVKVDPTCDAYGYYGFMCDGTREDGTKCDKINTIELYDPLGHKFGEWHGVEGYPALEQRECETCGAVESKTKQ